MKQQGLLFYRQNDELVLKDVLTGESTVADRCYEADPK
jgi:hypothetical protein